MDWKTFSAGKNEDDAMVHKEFLQGGSFLSQLLYSFMTNDQADKYYNKALEKYYNFKSCEGIDEINTFDFIP